MEESSSRKPSKLCTLKSRFHAHDAIARSLSPFCARSTMQLKSASPPMSSSSSPLRRSFITISSNCMCSSSSSTSAVADVQVPAQELRPKGKIAPQSASQKQIVPKKGFTGPFNKGYARVSDVSIKDMQASRFSESLKSEGKTKHRLWAATQNMQDIQTAYIETADACKWENSCARKFLQNYKAIVKYTWDPCRAFYESMMETVLAGCLDRHDYIDLEDMFACYIVLNSSQHSLHIEEAFKLLLTELYRMNGFGSVMR